MAGTETSRLWVASFRPRRIAIFVGLLLLLLGPWPLFAAAFTRAFAAYANAVVLLLPRSPGREARFVLPTAAERGDPDVGPWSVMVDLPPSAHLPLDTRILGYIPLALFLALAVVTDTRWRRKLRVLLLGGALILARDAVAIVLPIWRSLGGFPPGSLGRPLVEAVWWALIDSPAMGYATPLAVWLIALAVTTTDG